MHQDIRWGIIGPGAIAKEFTEDLVNIKEQRHYINAIVGKGKESTDAFLKHTHVDHVFYNIADLIQSNTIDCAYVSTPHLLHYEACLQLLDAGIPVLCEKPLAISARQVSEIIKKSEEKQTFFMEGMWIRFLPSIKQVLDIIASGKIGQINSVSGRLTYKAPYEAGNRYFNPALGGGSLLDLGVYPTYLAYLILGKPLEIKAVSKRTETNVDGGCAAVMQYDNAYAVMESSFIQRGPNEATIFGNLGSIHISEPWNEKPELITVQIYNGEKEEIKPEWDGKGLYFEVLEMMQCIKNSKIESSLHSHKNSLELMSILDEIRKQVNVKYPNE